MESDTGIQARLNNLGFTCGEVDGEIGSLTRTAIRDFQEAHDLDINGEIDDATLDKLKEIYGD